MSAINPKPAAGLLGGAVCTVGLGLAARHTGYDPSVEEVAGWTTLASFTVAWLVPDRLWRRSFENVEIDGMPEGAHAHEEIGA